MAQTALSLALAQSVDVGIWEQGGARVQEEDQAPPPGEELRRASRRKCPLGEAWWAPSPGGGRRPQGWV